MKSNFLNLVEQNGLFKTDHFTSNDIDKIVWEIYPELYGTQKIVSFMQKIPLKYYYFIPKNTFTWNELMLCIDYFSDDYDSLCPELVKLSIYHERQVFTLNSAENIISDALGIDLYRNDCKPDRVVLTWQGVIRIMYEYVKLNNNLSGLVTLSADQSASHNDEED